MLFTPIAIATARTAAKGIPAMTKATIRTDTDLISRLGCMRRNTLVANGRWGTIEHIELWVPAVPASALKLRQSDRRGHRGSTG